jgi:hypothetical protein
VISLQSNEKRGDAPFVHRSNDEHHGFCPSPWAEVIYSLAAMPHELIRLIAESAKIDEFCNNGDNHLVKYPKQGYYKR